MSRQIPETIQLLDIQTPVAWLLLAVGQNKTITVIQYLCYFIFPSPCCYAYDNFHDFLFNPDTCSSIQFQPYIEKEAKRFLKNKHFFKTY